MVKQPTADVQVGSSALGWPTTTALANLSALPNLTLVQTLLPQTERGSNWSELTGRPAPSAGREWNFQPTIPWSATLPFDHCLC